MANTAEAMLAEAAKHIGYQSRGAKFKNWYGAPMDWAWCAIFTSYVAALSGNADITGGKHQYTPSQAQWYKKRHQWRTGNPRPGDIVFFDFPDAIHRIQHVGIVEKVVDSRTIQTIEGNTAQGTVGSQYNGGGVWRRTRRTSSVVGYGRPAYRVAGAPRAPARADVPPVRHAMGWPNLKPGGGYVAEVTAMQAWLIAAGYDCGQSGADGDFGDDTAAAVAAYQKAVGLDPGAKVGRDTQAAMKAGKGRRSERPAGTATTTAATAASAVAREADAAAPRILKEGVRGKDVEALQRALNKAFPNYSKLRVDGSFGPKTAGTVREFQRRAGFARKDQDGVVGKQTRAALAKFGVKGF